MLLNEYVEKLSIFKVLHLKKTRLNLFKLLLGLYKVVDT